MGSSVIIPAVLAATFLGMVALVGAIWSAIAQRQSAAELRLARLASPVRAVGEQTVSLLAEPLTDQPGPWDRLVESLRLGRLLEQAGIRLSSKQFCLVSLALASGAAALMAAFVGWVWMIPAAVVAGSLPACVVWFQRRRRLQAFARQLPDALELVARALRAGHSLAAGIHLVGQEMAEPIGGEFRRCYEQQNLGVALEEALQEMTERVPNLDLRFFATAVILQRQTGGDLAEILDKISRLIRERFQIWGQIQALTGEGRLSGIVLLALPPVLFVVMYFLNPDYCLVLFRDPMGQKMLLGAVVMQVLGALVIRKIVNIEV
ncbi:MAG: secretion protein [Pirellulaceae bacterium]|nr:MAG: secretion protein [Pirellulaceae bacterium]